MPPLDFRSNLLFGLFIILSGWLVFVVITRLVLAWLSGRAARYDNEEALTGLRHTREWFDSLLLPSLVVIVVLWGLAFVMTGWVFHSSSEDPAGTLEEVVAPGQLFTGDNNPKTRTEELRKEGTELQNQQMNKLNDFRKEFFENRKETESDEGID